MDAGALQAAAAASAASYRSFADATRAVLDLLAGRMPDVTVLLAHLDRANDIYRVVDTRRGEAFGLRSNLARPLSDSLCAHMADDRGPRVCNDVSESAVYGRLAATQRVAPAAYLGVPLELSDGSRVGSLAALSREPRRFGSEDEQLFGMLARVLAYELERESNERDLRRMNESLRGQARGLAAVGRAARALTGEEDPRQAVCLAACEASGAPIGFLLEPDGRDLVSTASSGIEMEPVTIQARSDGDHSTAARAFGGLERYFVADARQDPAVAAPLVEATDARSALFEPILRDGRVAGVLILIWREQVAAPTDSVIAVLRLVAAQAAAAIQYASLRDRLGDLALSDALTGLWTRRRWDEELPRELARARRGEAPLCVAVVDLDRLGAFNLRSGTAEGDRLIKETAARWAGTLREVDLVARLDGGRFAVALPGCTLPEAVEVIERVRALTPRDQSASAGVARWNGDEPAELLTARAEDALDTAKAAGRDLTVAAD